MKAEELKRRLEADPDYRAAQQTPDLPEEIAEAVIELRVRAGLSQQELAERVGTGQANISRLEHAIAMPTLPFLQRVAAALGARLQVAFCPAAGEAAPATAFAQPALGAVGEDDAGEATLS